GHAKTGKVSLTKDRAGHDLPGSPDIVEGAALRVDPCVVGDLQAEIGEGNAGAKLIAVVGRAVDRPCPVGLRRIQPFSGEPVQLRWMEFARPTGLVELRDSAGKLFTVQPHLPAK